MKLFKPIISFLIFTFFVALPPLFLTWFYAEDFLVPNFWGIFFFVAGATLIVTMVVLLVQQKNSEIYAQAFLGGTTFKLLACLIFVFVFIKKTHPPKLFFVVDFMYLYFVNIGFEVYYLLRTLRHQKSR